MAERHVLLVDLDVWNGIRDGNIVGHERVALHVRDRAFGAFHYLEEPAVGGNAAAEADALGYDVGRRVGSEVHDLSTRVLVLARTCDRDIQVLGARAAPLQYRARVEHGHLAAEASAHPLLNGVFLHDGALGIEIVDVFAPILDGRVATARALFHEYLDNRRVQGVVVIEGRGASFDVLHRSALIDDDERVLELARGARVHAEVGLERHVDVHAFGHVEEGAARPHRAVERGELVLGGLDAVGHEVLLNHFGIFLHGGIGVAKDDA